MAHFAQIVNETVIQVIAVDNNDILDEQGNESESVGIQFCKDLLNGEWVQTSYNGNFRKNYAGIGFAYDEARDAFIAHRPWDSWILNVETCQWEAPIPYPDPVFAVAFETELAPFVAPPPPPVPSRFCKR